MDNKNAAFVKGIRKIATALSREANEQRFRVKINGEQGGGTEFLYIGYGREVNRKLTENRILRIN